MAIGTTIDGLNAVTSLTTNDEVPVWDKEASGEPTKKITGSNLASSVKTLGSLLSASDVVNDLASTATDKPGSANMLRELNEKLSLQKATVTLASGVTATLNVVAKQLNVVYLDLLCKKSQWAEGDLIATLPVEYRPTNIVHTFAVNYNMPSDNVQISIGTDGQIKIWNKGTQAQGNLYINILWFVGL